MGVRPLFDVSTEVVVAADPAQVWAVVSDLPRSGEWSTECVGGTWVSGRPATVGAVFRGENVRPEDVVAWAPVPRGTWFTESEIVDAEPERVLRWAVRTKSGRAQDSVWSFEIEPTAGGSVLRHLFRMGIATEGIAEITSGMDEAERRRFFEEWGEKVRGDMTDTVGRIKVVIEGSAA